MPVLDKLKVCYKIWQEYLFHFPRLARYTLGTKIDTLFTETLELILLAGYSLKEDKYKIVKKASVKFDALKFFIQIAWEIKALDNKKYIRISESLNEIGKMLGGWQKQLLKENPLFRSGK